MKIEKFQNLNQLSSISRKILGAVKKDDANLLLSLLDNRVSNKIIMAALENAVMNNSVNSINILIQLVDGQSKFEIAFNCLINNDEAALDKLKLNSFEMVEFLNIRDQFGQTNLHKIFDMAQASTSNYIINEYILKNSLEKSMQFTLTKENENILHTGIRKNITALSKMYDYIDINYFLSASSIDSYTPLHYIYSCDKDFFIKTLNKCEKNGVSLDIFNKFGSAPLTNLIRHNKLELIQILFNHYKPDLNHKSYNSYPLHTSIGSGHEDISLFLMAQGANVWQKNKIEIDSFWLACRFFKKNKKVFSHILNSITPEKVNELNLQSSSGNNIHRDYIKILAQHATLDALSMAYDKGLKEDNTQISNIISSALKSTQSNQKEKIDYLINKKHNSIFHCDLDTMYKEAGKFSYIRQLNDFFILEFIKNHAPTKVVLELQEFIKTYNVSLNSLDWTMAIYQSINQGNNELFNYCMTKTSTKEVMENIKSLQAKHSTSDLMPLLDIKHPEKINSLLKQSGPDLSEILIQMIGQSNTIETNQKPIQEILVHHPDFFNVIIQKVYNADSLSALIQSPEKLKNLIDFITVSAERWPTFLDKFIPILKTWPKEITQQLFSDELFMNKRMSSFSQHDLSYFFDNKHIENEVVQRAIITFSIIKPSTDYSYEKCAAIEKNLDYLFENGNFKFKDLLDMLFICAEPQYIPKITELLKKAINRADKSSDTATLHNMFENLNDKHNWNRLKTSSFYEVLKELDINISPYLEANIKSVNSGNKIGLKNREQKVAWHMENYKKDVSDSTIKDIYSSCFTCLNFIAAKALLDKYPDILNSNANSINLELLNNLNLSNMDGIEEKFNNLNKNFNISKKQFLTGFINSVQKEPSYAQLYSIDHIQKPIFQEEFYNQLFSSDSYLILTLINKGTNYLNSALEFIKSQKNEASKSSPSQVIKKYVVILDKFMKAVIDDPQYWNQISGKITNQPLLAHVEQCLLSLNIKEKPVVKKQIKI